MTTPSSRDRTASGVDVSQASIGDLLGEVTRDLSTLMRQGGELAKVELRQEATKAGKAARAFAGAGFAGYMVRLFLSFALWRGLFHAIDQGWAALVLAVICAVVGGVIYALGR